MAIKISALTAVVTPDDADEFAVNQAGTSKKETRAQIKTGAFDLDAATLTIDADADTSLSAATDDVVVLTLGGADVYNFRDTGLQIYSTDATAAEGPHLELRRNSASPADNDVIGDIRFIGEDDASNADTFAKIRATMLDVTSTTEDGHLSLQTMVAGTLTEILSVEPDLIDFNGNALTAHKGTVVTSVTGSLTTTAHSGNILVTSGNITVPTTTGFNATVVFGGAHTITFNSTVSAAMASGDIVSLFVESATVIHAVKVAAADKVSFS